MIPANLSLVPLSHERRAVMQAIRFRQGDQEKIVDPQAMTEDRHIDLAYALTVYGVQGASERFAIALTGTEGGRKRMASLESTYVTLSRAKEHVQVYTDDLAGVLMPGTQMPDRPPMTCCTRKVTTNPTPATDCWPLPHVWIKPRWAAGYWRKTALRAKQWRALLLPAKNTRHPMWPCRPGPVTGKRPGRC